MIDKETRIEPIVWNGDNMHYKDIESDSLDRIIKSELGCIKRSFISIGFFLRVASDHKVYEKCGYSNLYDYAQDKYGISRSSAIRYMQINKRFSRGGCSTIIDDKYEDFSKSQLQEMLTLSEDKVDEIKPEMTVKEIRKVANPEKPDPCCLTRDHTDKIKAPEPTQTSIDTLDLPVHTYNALKRAGVDTIEELQSRDITAIKGIGARDKIAIDKALSECATSHREEAEVVDNWPDILSDMPRFSKILVRDYLSDVESELKDFLACDGLPEMTILREQIKVAGVRLLMQLLIKEANHD